MNVEKASIGIELQIKLKDFIEQFQLAEIQIENQEDAFRKKEVDWQKLKDVLEQQVTQLQTVINDLRKKSGIEFDQYKSEVTQKINELNARLKKSGQDSALANELIGNLNSELTDKKKQVEQMQKKIESLLSENAAIEKGYLGVVSFKTDLEHKAVELERRSHELTSALNHKNSEVQNLKVVLEKHQAAYRNHQSHFLSFEKQLILKQNEIERIRLLAQTKIEELSQRHQMVEKSLKDSLEIIQLELKNRNEENLENVSRSNEVLRQKDQLIIKMEAEMNILKKEIHRLHLVKEFEDSRSKVSLEKVVYEYSVLKNNSTKMEEVIREQDAENKILKNQLKSLKEKLELSETNVQFHSEISRVHNEVLKDLKSKVDNEKEITNKLKVESGSSN